MDQPPSSNSVPGLRTLAAVVFTDAVGFSARMGADEMGTIKLLNRDFAEMRRLCAEHDGTVLKTTGDGLLLTFSSAVKAVACALAIQRQFAEEAKTKPNGLQHRVGIHLGDILFHNQDVMGDGVNIASRLQSEAEPGGICISQTVYDVVKNKVQMQAVSVGPRELKNISEAIPVYRILLEAALVSGSKSPLSVPLEATAFATAKSRAPGSRQKSRAGLWIGIALAAVAAIAVILLRPKPAAPAVAAAPTVSPSPSPSPSPTEAAPAVMTDEDFEKEVARRKDAMAQSRTQFLEKYDFAGFAKDLRDKGGAANVQGRAAAQQMQISADQMVTMKEWLDFASSRYARQRPLVVPDLSGEAARQFSLFGVPGNKVVVIENGVPTPPRAWTGFRPPMMASIIVAALRDARPAPQREVFFGARAFGQFFQLPLMVEAVNGMLPLNANRQGAPNPARQNLNPARQGQPGQRARSGP